MSSRAEIVDWAREIAEDIDLASVRGWLEDNPGRKACGYLPVWIPREIVHAAKLLPVGVHGGGDRIEIIRGDAYYQSYICHLPRSIVELLLSGRLDALSAMLFPSTCDVIRNLSGMWKVLKPGVYVRYVDLPHVRGDAGAGFFARELRLLLDDLAHVSGHRATDDDLRRSIAAYVEARDVVSALYAKRRDAPWSVPTEELYLLMRAGEVVPVDTFVEKAKAYLAAAERDPGRPRDNCRVIVVGSFCEQPPIGLLRTLERAGCYVVDDDLLIGNRLLEGDVPSTGDPVDALSRAFLATAAPTSILYEPNPDGKRQLMKRKVDAARADGIVFAAPSFCDPALLDRPMLRQGAEIAGIPCIAFNYAENTGQFQQFREQAGTFSDAIKLWGAK